MQKNVENERHFSDDEFKKILDTEKFLSNFKLQNNQENSDRNAFFDKLEETENSFNKESHIIFLKYSWIKIILRLIKISERFCKPFISDLHKNPILGCLNK